jgi:hypothetical protein
MELWLGAGHHGSTFASDEHRQLAWLRYRDRAMQWFAKDGRRPQAWWRYECPEGLCYPGYDREQSTLYEAGILGEDEASGLAAWWRKEFDRAWNPHFSFCDGPGKIFRGAVARRRHYAFIDLPASLRREWTLERRRHARAIRQQLATAPAA